MVKFKIIESITDATGGHRGNVSKSGYGINKHDDVNNRVIDNSQVETKIDSDLEMDLLKAMAAEKEKGTYKTEVVEVNKFKNNFMVGKKVGYFNLNIPIAVILNKRIGGEKFKNLPDVYLSTSLYDAIKDGKIDKVEYKIFNYEMFIKSKLKRN